MLPRLPRRIIHHRQLQQRPKSHLKSVYLVPPRLHPMRRTKRHPTTSCRSESATPSSNRSFGTSKKRSQTRLRYYEARNASWILHCCTSPLVACHLNTPEDEERAKQILQVRLMCFDSFPLSFIDFSWFAAVSV